MYRKAFDITLNSNLNIIINFIPETNTQVQNIYPAILGSLLNIDKLYPAIGNFFRDFCVILTRPNLEEEEPPLFPLNGRDKRENDQIQATAAIIAGQAFRIVLFARMVKNIESEARNFTDVPAYIGFSGIFSDEFEAELDNIIQMMNDYEFTDDKKCKFINMMLNLCAKIQHQPPIVDTIKGSLNNKLPGLLTNPECIAYSNSFTSTENIDHAIILTYMDDDSNDWSHADIDSEDRETDLKNIANAAKIAIEISNSKSNPDAVVDFLVEGKERDMLINDLNTYLTDRGKTLGDLFPNRELGTGPVPSLNDLDIDHLLKMLTRIYNNDEQVRIEALEEGKNDMILGDAVAKGVSNVNPFDIMAQTKKDIAISKALGGPSAMGNLGNGIFRSQTQAAANQTNQIFDTNYKRGTNSALAMVDKYRSISTPSILSTKRSIDYANINGEQTADNNREQTENVSKRERTGSESDSEEDMDGGKNKKRKTRKHNKQIKRKTKKNKKQRKTKKDVKRIKRRQTKRR